MLAKNAKTGAKFFPLLIAIAVAFAFVLSIGSITNTANTALARPQVTLAASHNISIADSPSVRIGKYSVYSLGHVSQPDYSKIISPCTAHTTQLTATNYTQGIYNCQRASSSYEPAAQQESKASTVYSFNWAGYASTTSSADAVSVKGSWIVQTANPTVNNTYSSEWIGIGGYSTADLIQTGTESDYYNEKAHYYAWYELLPASETEIKGMTITPGDLVEANITLVPGTTNEWNVTLIDTTTGIGLTLITGYNSLKESSEWVEERPSFCSKSSCSITNLSDFGTAYYGVDYTKIPYTNFGNMGSGFYDIAGLPGVEKMDMVNSEGSVIATTSSLSSDDTSFTDVSNGYQSTTSSSSTTSASTTTVPSVTYTATYCSGENNAVSEQCSVPASSNPGIFCWASAQTYSISSPSWPVAQSESAFGAEHAAEVGSPWTSGSTCSVSIPSQADISIGGLSVTSSGAMSYGGETSGGSDSGKKYKFTYSTDPGKAAEAVALMVACGGSTCNIKWPAGCSAQSTTDATGLSQADINIALSKTSSTKKTQALALCNQTEGKSYSVTVTPKEVGEAIVVADSRFENGAWT